jgi:hypothetical protein
MSDTKQGTEVPQKHKPEISEIKTHVITNLVRELGNSNALSVIGASLQALGLRASNVKGNAPSSETSLPIKPKQPSGRG